jgi:hypothetical protein
MNWNGAFRIDDQLACTNAAGEERTFEVRVQPIDDPDGPIWHYLVAPLTPADRSGKLYFAEFQQIEEGMLQSGGLRNDLPPLYQRCRITRALFALVAKRHNATIRSSRKYAPGEESRSAEATRVWESMVGDHLAEYNPTEDRFYYGVKGR